MVYTNTKDLKLAFEVLTNAFSKRTQLHVLKNVKVETKGNKIYFTTTDLDNHASVEMEGHTEVSSYSILVNFAEISNAVKKCTSETVEMFFDEENHVFILQGNITYRFLANYDVDDFPDVNVNIDPVGEISFDNKRLFLKYIKDMTTFMINNQFTRKSLHGILMAQTDDHVDLVATDVHRLSLLQTKQIEIPCEDVVLPFPVVNLINKIGKKEDFKLIVGSETTEKTRWINFIINESKYNISYITRGVRNEFPNHRLIIPSGYQETGNLENSISFTGSSKEFSGILGQFINFYKKAVTIVNMTNDREGMKVFTISGDCENQMGSVVAWQTDDPDLGFVAGVNAKYLKEALDTLPNSPLTIKRDETPLIFLREKTNDHIHFHVIMPAKV